LRCCFESTAVPNGRVATSQRRSRVLRRRRRQKLRTAKKDIFHRCFRACNFFCADFFPTRSVSRAGRRDGARKRVAGAVERQSGRARVQVESRFFSLCCSNQNAVQSIRDRIVRYRHSLNARRAAWRRKLSQRPSQRQRRRRVRPRSARRRSNDAASELSAPKIVDDFKLSRQR